MFQSHLYWTLHLSLVRHCNRSFVVFVESLFHHKIQYCVHSKFHVHERKHTTNFTLSKVKVRRTTTMAPEVYSLNTYDELITCAHGLTKVQDERYFFSQRFGPRCPRAASPRTTEGKKPSGTHGKVPQAPPSFL